MKMKAILLSGLLTLTLFSLAVGGEKYNVDVAHSSIGFSVKHLVISNTKGEFKDFSGVINYDAEDISKSSVEITINTASIDTDDAKRDGHLKSPDFLDVEKHKTITFKSTKIQKTDAGFVAVGNLTIRDITKEVKLPFTLTGPIKDPWGYNRLGVEASLTIDRHDFGVSWSKTLDNGGLVVGNDVKISLDIECIQAKEGTN